MSSLGISVSRFVWDTIKTFGRSLPSLRKCSNTEQNNPAPSLCKFITIDQYQIPFDSVPFPNSSTITRLCLVHALSAKAICCTSIINALATCISASYKLPQGGLTFETDSRVCTLVRILSVMPITADSAGTKLPSILKSLCQWRIPSDMCHEYNQCNLLQIHTFPRIIRPSE